jgi:CubicO group peptidase (beta-lactamase class C family)
MTTSALEPAEPQSVGLSGSRLRRISAALRREIEAQQIPGAVIAIARCGKRAHLEAAGHRDPGSKEPLKTDAIFSIASMTKAMTSVAIMSLVEEGRILLADPVSKFLPALAAWKVAEPSGNLRPPKQPPTVQDLLRHTSGLTYRDRGTTAAHALYPGSSVWAAERMPKEETIAALAKAPLLFDPGTSWEYGFSTDVLGFIVEAVTGSTLGTVLKERVWCPLAMNDTSFALPADKRGRYARALAKDPLTGDANPIIHHATDNTQKWESGGGGTISTASDYLRFAEMLRRDGRIGSADILGRGTVALMTADAPALDLQQHDCRQDGPRRHRLRFRPWVRRSPPGWDRRHGRQRGRLLLVGRVRHLLLDRPERGTQRRVHGRRARPDPPALPADDAQSGLPGAALTGRATASAHHFAWCGFIGKRP